MTAGQTPTGLPTGEQDRKGHDLPWWAQVGATLAAVITAVGALAVACQGQQTVAFNARSALQQSQTALRQSDDAQLSAAIADLGSGDAAERVAGLVLLARNTSARFAQMAQTREPPSQVFADYTTALQILSGYLRNHSQAFVTAVNAGKATPAFGLGYGQVAPTAVPLDLVYAGDQVRNLGKMEKQVRAAADGARPAIDLSYDDLISQPWHGVNLGWITVYMPGTDLRGADLSYSQWSQYSDLSHSYLQCADLAHANFSGANLTYADLRGADVQDANFSGAHIRGVRIGQLYGHATWPQWKHGITALPVSKWNQAVCLQDKTLWDYPLTNGKGTR